MIADVVLVGVFHGGVAFLVFGLWTVFVVDTPKAQRRLGRSLLCVAAGIWFVSTPFVLFAPVNAIFSPVSGSLLPRPLGGRTLRRHHREMRVLRSCSVEIRLDPGAGATIVVNMWSSS